MQMRLIFFGVPVMSHHVHLIVLTEFLTAINFIKQLIIAILFITAMVYNQLAVILAVNQQKST